MYKGLSKITLLVIALLTILALTQFPSLRFTYDFENFFPREDEDLVYYNEFRKEFAPDNDFILFKLLKTRMVYFSLISYKK